MAYGPLFRKYMALSHKKEMSATKLSGLNKDEIIEMCHIMYDQFPSELHQYYKRSIEELISILFSLLKEVQL